MSRSHYFYLRLTVSELEEIVEAYKTRFETMLGDTFSSDELQSYESMIDTLAAVYVQPILPDLSFDDFYENPKLVREQKSFFETSRSSICLDQLSYFESNPFQVTYLKDLLNNFEEVLIDQGGTQELVFKQTYLDTLAKYKDLDGLILKGKPVLVIKTSRPVDPIDFLVRDVYREIVRLRNEGKLLGLDVSDLSEKVQKIYRAYGVDELDATNLLRKTGLNPKEFDDGLERLKVLAEKALSFLR